MTLYEQVIAAGRAPASEIAARLGICKHTVYRWRKRKPHKIDYERLAELVKSCGGDKRKIHKLLDGEGYARSSRQHYRHQLLISRRITPDDWPAMKRIDKGRDGRVLMAMVKAGASQLQVAQCFGVSMHMAAKEIREAWVLIELSSSAAKGRKVST